MEGLTFLAIQGQCHPFKQMPVDIWNGDEEWVDAILFIKEDILAYYEILGCTLVLESEDFEKLISK